MELSLTGQILDFASAVVLGGFLGFVYDCMRIIRGRLPLRAVTAVLDGLFWIVCAMTVFWFAMRHGDGELRLFVLTAVLIGIVFYFCLLSAFVRTVGFILADGAAELAGVLLRPVIAILKIIHKIFTNLFSFCRKWYILLAKQLKRRRRPRGEGDEKAQGEPAGQAGHPRFRHMVGHDAHQPPRADQRKKSRIRRFGKPARGAKTPHGDRSQYRI
jgi:spore cortex biosynthesis protein YabQ